MPELVPMPKLGFDMAEGTLVRKVKQPGQDVKKGDVLAEIETDKATVEVESPATGVVKGWLVEEGQAVPVGQLMAVIGAPDEQVDLDSLRKATPGEAGAAAAQAPAEQPATPAEPPATPAATATTAAKRDNHGDGAAPAPKATAAPSAPVAASGPAAPSASPAAPTPAPSPAPTGATAPVSPIARKMAAEAGIDLGQISGTGPGGRITKKDIEAFQQQPATARAAPAPQTPPTPAVAVPTGEDQIVPLTRMRQAIARRMSESNQSIPQFYINSEIDMAAAMELRKQLNELLPDDAKLSVNDLIIKAAALALREFPNLNASFAGDKVVRKAHINIGNAVALEAGLLTVVVRDAEQKSLAQIAAEMKAMVARVRSGKVQGADIEGSTFSISNLGKFDVEHFVAIINPPEAAILATGTVRPVPVVKDGAVVAGLRLMATLSADHRVSDGAEAAQFMQSVKHKLEQPFRLVL